MYLARYLDGSPMKSAAKTAARRLFLTASWAANISMYLTGYINSAVALRHFAGEDGLSIIDSSFRWAQCAAAGCVSVSKRHAST